MNIEEAKSIIDTNYQGIHSAHNIRLNTENVAPFVEVEGFKDMNCIRHGFSTRFGGVSKGIFESMNLGRYLGDDIDDVEENYKRI